MSAPRIGVQIAGRVVLAVLLAAVFVVVLLPTAAGVLR